MPLENLDPLPDNDPAQTDTLLSRPRPVAVPEIAEAGDPLIGAMAGSFRIVRLLGYGGMGSVYLAEHPVIGNKVAIKFLHESLAQDPDTVWRFYQEARAAHVVGHENIVSIYDLNLLPPKRYYMVMEHLEGETLSAMLQRGPVQPQVMLQILLQLCDALQCAHEAGVVHRDLKPDNVFLVERRGQKNFVKLVDFGIAKLREGGKQSASFTRAGTVIGTPDYMAPEQCEGLAVDARSDLYALGVIAFRLATGQLPFQCASVPQTLLAQLQKAPPLPRSLNPALDPGLERAILRALAKSPEDRFQSMRAFGEALSEVLARAQAPLKSPVPPPAEEPLGPAAAGTPQPSPGLDIEVRFGDRAPRLLRGLHLSRSAVFLCADEDFPPLFSRLRVSIASRRGPIELEADVIRHVGPQQARTFGGATGFALQFVAPPPPVAEELAALSSLLTPAKAAPGEDAQAAALLAKYRGQASHYEVLGLPLDVEFADVLSRGRCARRELEGLRSRPLGATLEIELGATLGRIDAAIATLSSLEKRVAYDGELGNFQGVARSLAAGFASLRLDELHARRRRERPEVDARVQQHLCRIRLARALGNTGAVIAEYEQALRLDPLSRALHEGWAEARGGRR